VSQELLDQNADLGTLRTLSGWPALVQRARIAAAAAANVTGPRGS
jgi:hypothetical protein